MRCQRAGPVAIVALGYALVFSSEGVLAATFSDDSSLNGCTDRFIGDGDCDLTNDNEDCGEWKMTKTFAVSPMYVR